jgi:hypothetical protein
MAWVIAFVRDAPLWAMLLVVLGSYVVALGATRVFLPRWLPASQTAPLETEAGTRAQHTYTDTTAEKPIGDTHKDIMQRCRDLADDLRQFLEDNAGKGRDETARLYHRQLGDRAGALLEELEERGLYPPQNLKSF